MKLLCSLKEQGSYSKNPNTFSHGRNTLFLAIVLWCKDHLNANDSPKAYPTLVSLLSSILIYHHLLQVFMWRPKRPMSCWFCLHIYSQLTLTSQWSPAGQFLKLELSGLCSSLYPSHIQSIRRPYRLSDQNKTKPNQPSPSLHPDVSYRPGVQTVVLQNTGYCQHPPNWPWGRATLTCNSGHTRPLPWLAGSSLCQLSAILGIKCKFFMVALTAFKSRDSCLLTPFRSPTGHIHLHRSRKTLRSAWALAPTGCASFWMLSPRSWGGLLSTDWDQSFYAEGSINWHHNLGKQTSNMFQRI